MSFVRRIRLEYYEVVCKKREDDANIPDRKFDLNLWIERVSKLSLEARTFDYYQEQARLDKFWYDDKNNVWFLNFLRLRETNIPSKAKKDKEAEPLSLDDDEYIGEDANALYDEKLGILMLQRNRHSLGVRGIEEYLNLVWKSTDEVIYLRPICPINLQEKAKKAYEYRRLSIRFADIKNKDFIGNNNKPLKKIVDILGGYNAINAEISITMGYNKNDSLDKNTVKDSLDDIMGNKNIITKAEIGIKETDDASVEVIDLFADKIHDFIFVNLEKRESLASEYVAYHMLEKYNESKYKVLDSLRERKGNV